MNFGTFVLFGYFTILVLPKTFSLDSTMFKRTSNISTTSTETSESGDQLVVVGKEKLSSVEIERNDSGLGSETGRARVSSKVVVRKRSDQQTEELLCLDCDQVLETQGRER